MHPRRKDEPEVATWARILGLVVAFTLLLLLIAFAVRAVIKDARARRR
jgi:hypothetical protein